MIYANTCNKLPQQKTPAKNPHKNSPNKLPNTTLQTLQQVDILQESVKIFLWNAEVAELADALRSGRSGHYAREGSNPSFGTLTP